MKAVQIGDKWAVARLVERENGYEYYEWAGVHPYTHKIEWDDTLDHNCIFHDEATAKRFVEDNGGEV